MPYPHSHTQTPIQTEYIYSNHTMTPVSYTHLDVYKRQLLKETHVIVLWNIQLLHFKHSGMNCKEIYVLPVPK